MPRVQRFALSLVCTAGGRAYAQDYAAIAPFPDAPEVVDVQALALEGGDMLLFDLRPGGTGGVAHLDRRRPDLTLVWSTDVPLETIGIDKGQELKLAFREFSTPDRPIVWARPDLHGGSLSVHTWVGGSLFGVPIDLATGAPGVPNKLGPMAAPVGDPGATCALCGDGFLGSFGGVSPARASFAENSGWIAFGDPVGGSLRVMDPARKATRELRLPTGTGPAILGMDQDGTVLVLGPAPEGVRLSAFPVKGKATAEQIPELPWDPTRTTLWSAGGRRYVVQRPPPGEDDFGTNLGIALRNLSEDDTILTIVSMPSGAAGHRVHRVTRRSLNSQFQAAGIGKASGAAWLSLVLMHPLSDGGLLIGLRTQEMVTTTTTRTSNTGASSTSTRITYRAGDLVALRLDGESAPTWVTRVDMRAETLFPDVFQLHTNPIEGGLQLLYRGSGCSRSFTPVLCTRTLDPNTGTATEASAAVPFVPDAAYWVPSLTAPLGGGDWLVGLQSGRLDLRQALRGTVDRPVLLATVALDAPLPVATRRNLAPDPDTLSAEFQAGSIMGAMGSRDVRRGAGLRGFGVGVGVGALGGLMMGASGSGAPGPIVLGFFGSPIAAAVTARVTVRPARGWYTSRSPEFQAGYSASARRSVGRRAALGSVPGTMLGMMIGFVGGAAIAE